MKSFESFCPTVLFVYFLTVTAPVMFSSSPVLLCISLVGALLFCSVRNGSALFPSLPFYALVFSVTALINPLFSHNGKTVLFLINDSPITLEAAVYGAVMATALVSVLLWFRSFSEIMTSDKLLYIFGKVSPKLALVISMALRYVPLFRRQAKKINDTQTAMGLYRDDNIIDRIKGGARVFSVMVTWALENGIVTADSMAARGYGNTKRTHFSVYRFGRRDALLLICTLFCGIAVIFSALSGAFDMSFYPTLEISKMTAVSVIGHIFYFILSLLPVIIEIKEAVKWKYLRSKI